MSDCTKRMTPVCNEVQHEVEAVGECPKFTAPLPLGGSISSNGYCVNYTAPAAPPADGTYGKVVVENGVITGVAEEEVEQYTSSPCAPIPTPCDCQGESGSLPQPSTVSGNLFGYDAANRPYAVLNAEAGDGIALTGNGTSANPLVISANTAELNIAVQSGNSAITVTGTGSSEDPFVITHKRNDFGSAKYNGFSFDAYGHFIGYETPTDEKQAIRDLVAGSGISISREGSLATISLAGALGDGEFVPNGEYIIGGYRLKVLMNQLASLTQEITIPAAIYTIGGYQLGLNEYGSVESIAQGISIPAQAWNIGGYTVTTNTVGSITAIAEDTAGVATNGKSIRNGATSVSSMSTTITLAHSSGLRVSATCKGTTMPTTVSVNIDGSAITTDAMGNRAEAISDAIYAAGTHTVTLAASSAITGPVYLDIWMVEVV